MTQVEHAPGAVDALADRFWDRILDLSPITATVYGMERGSDTLDDPGPEGRDKLRAVYEETLREAASLSGAGSNGAEQLSTEDEITLDLLRVVSELGIEQLDLRLDRLRVVDQVEGPQTVLPMIAALQPSDTPERFERLLERLKAYPAFMAANADIVREGLETGLTAARIVAERVVSQLERLLAVPPEDSPVVKAVNVASEVDRDRLIATVRDYVQPADAEFLEAFRGAYMAATREDPGLWSAPDGERIYASMTRGWTSLEIDPAEVHRIGLEELEAIELERREIARAAGFGDDTLAARAAFLAAPGARPRSGEEYIERARGQIERALAAAPRFFGRLPRAGVDVWPVEPYKQADSPFAYYYPPAVDGSRPGVYWVNTYQLHNRSYLQLAATSFHEAVPGHHFQIALEAENTSLNTFRRLGARMAGTAYTEGWGLYSERLADEMGLYLDATERLGMLDAQAWRAARLVVDTGIHALRWSREQGQEQMRRAGISETDAVIETDRFICWPGQALTYKLGQREIERLRREIAGRLGSAFDLRAFHDEVIGHGTLPLRTLARELPIWLGAAEK